MPIVPIVFQVCHNTNLGNTARRVGAKHLQLLNFLLILAGNHTTNANAW
ncbi:hypothetical protein C3B55_00867 [Candidatus Pseudomonas adelgestsugas]|uniref:Uncharacterized protein n=1 Tax=Candidatus Pseudomonas adelgestsugas TaxID=1302376 RepID=A0ABX5RA93_9PSED|nr:hypothetical protein C3B55_00867 [Candidatus Pseudomonas adelgestsugas]